MTRISAVSTVAEEGVGEIEGDAPILRDFDGVALTVDVNDVVAVVDPETVEVGEDVIEPVLVPVCVPVSDAVPVLLPVTDELIEGVCELVM